MGVTPGLLCVSAVLPLMWLDQSLGNRSTGRGHMAQGHGRDGCLPDPSQQTQLDPSHQQEHVPALEDFPGGAVVGNPPANAGDTGLSPGLGGSHMLQSN